MIRQPTVTLDGSGGEWAYMAELGSCRVFGELTDVSREYAEEHALRHLRDYMRGAAASDPAKYGSARRERELRGGEVE